MKTFSDNTDREWTVAINVDVVKRVRSLLDVDLLAATDGTLIERLVSDPILLCDVLYVVCKPQADEQGVTDEAFGRAMGGEAIDDGTTALLEELVDFFPQAKRRVLAKALVKLRRLESKAATMAEQRLDSPELEAQLDAILNAPGLSSGSSPASPGSPPAH
jgi:hypothetical protein